MFTNLFWVSIIIVLLGFIFLMFFHFYEKTKNKVIDEQKALLVKIKFQYYILIFIFILGISVSGLFYLNNRKIFDYYNVDVGMDPIKLVQNDISNNKYDSCIAYGQLISIYRLIDMDILNEEEEKILIESRSIWNLHPRYNIAFVQKDNIDYILLFNLNRKHDSYMFKSHLPYSFDDLLSLFQEASNTELSDEFLNGRDSGVFFTITQLYVDYYYVFISDINGQKYYVYYDNELVILK